MARSTGPEWGSEAKRHHLPAVQQLQHSCCRYLWRKRRQLSVVAHPHFFVAAHLTGCHGDRYKVIFGEIYSKSARIGAGNEGPEFWRRHWFQTAQFPVLFIGHQSLLRHSDPAQYDKTTEGGNCFPPSPCRMIFPALTTCALIIHVLLTKTKPANLTSQANGVQPLVQQSFRLTAPKAITARPNNARLEVESGAVKSVEPTVW
jgi:hypothetical protein